MIAKLNISQLQSLPLVLSHLFISMANVHYGLSIKKNSYCLSVYVYVIG